MRCGTYIITNENPSVTSIGEGPYADNTVSALPFNIGRGRPVGLKQPDGKRSDPAEISASNNNVGLSSSFFCDQVTHSNPAHVQ